MLPYFYRNLSLPYEEELEKYGLILVQTYQGVDYGPLSYYEKNKNHAENFRCGKYSAVKSARKNGIMLHRLTNSKYAFDAGQYFTLEPKLRSLETDADLIVTSDKDRMAFTKNILVPPGFIIFIGIIAPKNVSKYEALHGDGVQIFIPNEYLKYIIQAQSGNKFKRYEAIEAGLEAQRNLFDAYQYEASESSREYLRGITSDNKIKKLIKTGNNLQNLPKTLRSALETLDIGNQTNLSVQNKIETGEYTLHRDSIRLPNGKIVYLLLSIKVDYLFKRKREVLVKNAKIIQIIHNYRVTYFWYGKSSD